MPRNGSGTFSLVKPAFQPQTSISSADVNADLADIANGLTGSLPRDGQAPMNGTLPLAPSGFVYSNDDDTGIYRSNSNEQTIKCGGQPALVIKPDGVYTGGGAEISSFVLGVPYPWIFSTPAPGTVFAVGQPCTSAYPRLRALLVNDGAPYGNNGVDPLFPNLGGVVIAGRTTMGGADRGNLTGGNVLGATIGAQTVTLTEAQIPAHDHTGAGTTSTNGNHTHTGSGTTSSVGDHTHTGAGNTSGESANHSHTFSGTTSTMTRNSVHSHGARLPNARVTSSSGIDSSTYTYNTGTNIGIEVDQVDINHEHSYNGTTSGASNGHYHSFSFTTSGAGGHSHTYNFTTTTNGDHAHSFSFTTSATGGGNAHNNVQPTIILNYIMRAA